MKLDPLILKRMDKIESKSSSVFNAENDDDKDHHELLRYSGMKTRKVEPTVKRIWKI